MNSPIESTRRIVANTLKVVDAAARTQASMAAAMAAGGYRTEYANKAGDHERRLQQARELITAALEVLTEGS